MSGNVELTLKNGAKVTVVLDHLGLVSRTDEGSYRVFVGPGNVPALVLDAEEATPLLAAIDAEIARERAARDRPGDDGRDGR